MEPASIEKIKDEVERNIKDAIELASEIPFSTIIVTTEDRRADYEKHPHYKTASNVKILADEKCLDLINIFFKRCELT